MEETLQPFAALCGLCPQKLAEEISSMSPEVEKRFEKAQEKSHQMSWLQAWEDEADRREKENPGGVVCEALYFVRGLFPGTGSLESRFFKGRQTNHARHMTEQSVNDRMRIFMNGPAVEAFCSRRVEESKTRYRPSALCQRSQAGYRKLFGSKSLHGREQKFKRPRGKDQ